MKVDILDLLKRIEFLEEILLAHTQQHHGYNLQFPRNEHLELFCLICNNELDEKEWASRKNICNSCEERFSNGKTPANES